MADNLKNRDKKRQTGLEPSKNALPDFSRLLSNIGFRQDRDSFAKIFQYFAPRVKSYMVKLGCVDEMAEELAQQTPKLSLVFVG